MSWNGARLTWFDTPMSDPLEQPGALTKLDHAFLTGTWEGGWGAAMGICLEWCRNCGYGGYNAPTELGKKRIAEYERVHKL